jgi:hypothetical protein
MTTYGFARVDADGFLGMLAVLREGAWAEVPLPASSDQPTTEWNLLSQEVRAKVRLTEALGLLRQAVGAEDRAVELDQTWDRLQRRLDGMLTADTYHDDPDRQAAAQRLRKLLTLGNGTGQTGLSFQAEVDFGNRQALLVGHECAADVALLGYGPLFVSIDAATRALAAVLGRNDGSGRAVRSERLRDALSRCVTAFNLTLAELDEGLARLPDGPVRAVTPPSWRPCVLCSTAPPPRPPRPRPTPPRPRAERRQPRPFSSRSSSAMRANAASFAASASSFAASASSFAASASSFAARSASIA